MTATVTVSSDALVGATDVVHTRDRIATNVRRGRSSATDTSGGDRINVVTVLVVEDAAPLNVTVTAIAPTTPQVGAPVAFTATVTQPAGTPAIDRYESGASATTAAW